MIVESINKPSFLSQVIIAHIFKKSIDNYKEDLWYKNYSLNYPREYINKNTRIKNILTFLNQIIKHFQNEGYINKTCVFEVKRMANIPKRQIQILTTEQQAQLLKIIKKKYSYMLPIVQKLITLKQPLNSFLTGGEQEKKSLKRKIRKDFYKIKQELRLINYMLDDLRFCSF